MALSIGIDYTGEQWKGCVIEDGQVIDSFPFKDATSVLAALMEKCALYPEPCIAISTLLDTPFTLLKDWSGQCSQEGQNDLFHFLNGLQTNNLTGYIVPALAYLPTIPHYRHLLHHPMGSTDTLCSIATLLYRLRQRNATAAEMNFLYLEASATTYGITVISQGSIVDNVQRALQPPAFLTQKVDTSVRLEAFWEGVTQDLAALMATHHLEDVIIVDRYDAPENEGVRTEAVVERYGDTYQCYHFPTNETEPEGFEVATGAAVLAEGLCQSGLAREVVQQLLSISQ